MVDYIVFDNEITLYWDNVSKLSKKRSYKVFVDDKEISKITNTHYSIRDLSEQKTYGIKIIMLDEYKEEIIFNKEITTLAKKKKLDITKPPYNAVSGGFVINTSALQKAIDDCAADECVYIPEGVFLTGALNLHSNMEIYIENGGVLQGTSDLDDYTPKIKSRFEGIEMMCYRSLINMGELDRDGGYNCENIVIRGGGTIYGGGEKLANNTIEFEKECLKEFLEQNADYVATCENAETIPARRRGRLINISNCNNVVICNVVLGFSPSWNVHMIYSNNILTYGCIFHSENIWNGDGWDPDSSKNCTVFGCQFFTGDDAIAIKSGKNPEGNIINRPCERIRVFDCIDYFGHGITIGSEMSGGVNNVKIWNCDLRRSLHGVQIKATKKRGGYVKNICINDCVVSQVLMHSVSYNDDGISAPSAPVFENFTFENLNIMGMRLEKNGNNTYCNPIKISGFDTNGDSIRNIKFKNVLIDNGNSSVKQQIVLQRCEGVTFENIHCK